MAANLGHMPSSSNMSKLILKNLLKIASDILEKQNAFSKEITGKDWSQRLQIYRQKAKKTNKLTVKEHLELVDEMVRNNDAKYLDDPKYKEFKTRIAILENSLVDSDGYFDITDMFGTNVFMQNLSLTEKLKSIFIAIDENGDGTLSRPEVEKFFNIILKNTLIILRDGLKNYKSFGISDENAMEMNKFMPELEKIFDPSKITRLVNGAFTADTNNDGLISFTEWEVFIEAGNFKEQWGTISLLFDSN